MIPQFTFCFSILIEKGGVASVQTFIFTYESTPIYDWNFQSEGQEKSGTSDRIWSSLFFSQLLEEFAMWKPQASSRLVSLEFSISFKACFQNCCHDRGECWFLLNTLQICMTCSILGKMPLWRDMQLNCQRIQAWWGAEGGRKEGTKNKMSP